MAIYEGSYTHIQPYAAVQPFAAIPPYYDGLEIIGWLCEILQYLEGDVKHLISNICYYLES